MSDAPAQPLLLSHADAAEFPRRHPDIFTAREAAAYLGLDSVRCLETLRKDFGLIGYQPAGRSYLYHRENLDRVAAKMFGKEILKTEGRRR